MDAPIDAEEEVVVEVESDSLVDGEVAPTEEVGEEAVEAEEVVAPIETEPTEELPTDEPEEIVDEQVVEIPTDMGSIEDVTPPNGGIAEGDEVIMIDNEQQVAEELA